MESAFKYLLGDGCQPQQWTRVTLQGEMAPRGPCFVDGIVNVADVSPIQLGQPDIGQNWQSSLATWQIGK